jgi:hypothetical protein
MAKLTGGGIQSSVNRSVGVRTGSRTADKISPAGVSQLGIHPGDRLTREGGHTGRSSALPIVEGQKPAAAQMGNAKALDVKGGGPGTGRTTMRSGSQGTHGPVAGQPLPSTGEWVQREFPGVPTAKGR